MMKNSKINSVNSILSGYKPLYKGRRYWVFENDPNRPFGGWTDDMNLFQILLYDKLFENLMASGVWNEDGTTISGGVLWGQGVDFTATGPRDMVDTVLGIAKWYR